MNFTRFKSAFISVEGFCQERLLTLRTLRKAKKKYENCVFSVEILAFVGFCSFSVEGCLKVVDRDHSREGL